MPVEPARAPHMHLRLRRCCGRACLRAGATLPNESSSVHLGSPAEIFFALRRASRLAFGAAFLSRGKRFRRWRGHSIQAFRTTFAVTFSCRIPTKVQCRSLSPSVHSTNATLTDQHRLYPPTLRGRVLSFFAPWDAPEQGRPALDPCSLGA